MPTSITRFSTPFHELLIRDYYAEVIDVPEIVQVMGVSASQVRKIIRREAQIEVSQAIRWCKYRFSMDDPRYSRLFMPTSGDAVKRVMGSADGSADNEVVEIVHTASGFARGLEDRDLSRVDRSINIIKTEVLPNMEAERALLASDMTP